jgi:hypothetical protein
MHRRITVPALVAVLVLACACPVGGGFQQTIDAVQNTIGAALTEVPAMMTEMPAMLTALPEVSPEGAQPGFLRGNLSYPSEFLPAQTVVAFDAVTMAVVAQVTTAEGQGQYELAVPAGDYYVVAYVADGSLAAGYSEAVPCGLSAACTDHTLIAVHVDPGAIVEDIDPQDWYAPPGTFPAMP